MPAPCPPLVWPWPDPYTYAFRVANALGVPRGDREDAVQAGLLQVVRVWEVRRVWEHSPAEQYRYLRATLVGGMRTYLREQRRLGMRYVPRGTLVGITAWPPLSRTVVARSRDGQQALEAWVESRQRLRDVLVQCDARERWIVEGLLQGATQAELAEQLGVDPTRVSQILRALRARGWGPDVRRTGEGP